MGREAMSGAAGPTIRGKKPVIFCDFDGTITENDNIIAIVKHFRPAGWEAIVADTIGQRITVQEGVGRLFALLPTRDREAIVRFAVDNIRIRAGFAELLRLCREHDIRFLVTSGGIDFFVYPALAPFVIEPEHIYCNRSDFSGETVRILWPHACDAECESGGCGMCKPAIIRAYPKSEYTRILIGDSVTDFAGAKLADVIFARSHLADKCAELGMPYCAYETFHTVTARLHTMLEEDRTTDATDDHA